MKNFKIITGIALMSILGFTSCQSEIDNTQGQNPNTNAANSTTANNFKRTAMYDGSSDDFLDGTSCSSIVLPATARINGIQVSLFSQFDYQQVISILASNNMNEDVVELQFPLKVKLSNYSEVTINNQNEYNTLMQTCGSAESANQDAISGINIDFPISIMTYSLSKVETGSVVIQSEQDLYLYMSTLTSDKLFSINYPISITNSAGAESTISSDVDFQSRINESISAKATMEIAATNAHKLETILVNGMFKVDSFVDAGVNSATNYAAYTMDFASNLTLAATSSTSSTVSGTYAASSDLNVLLKLNFNGFTSLNLLNNTWKVTSFSATTISLQSQTNAAVTLVLKQI